MLSVSSPLSTFESLKSPPTTMWSKKLLQVVEGMQEKQLAREAKKMEAKVGGTKGLGGRT